MASQRHLGGTLQCALVGATLALAVAPPADGVMLVAPLLPATAGGTLEWVLQGGARLVAPGPYAGSFVVYGSRAVLLVAALSHGALLLTARYPACGSNFEAIR